jgi:Na+/phosphate symporter
VLKTVFHVSRGHCSLSVFTFMFLSILESYDAVIRAIFQEEQEKAEKVKEAYRKNLEIAEEASRAEQERLRRELARKQQELEYLGREKAMEVVDSKISISDSFLLLLPL